MGRHICGDPLVASMNKKVTLNLPPAHPMQHELITKLDKDPNLKFIIGACGSKFGKLISLSTLIPTTCGVKELRDLKEGDYVFAVDGSPTLVEYITDTVIPEIAYKVTFSDGTEVIACSEHLWETTTHTTRKNLARVNNPKDRTKSTNSKAEVLTTQQIKDTLNYECNGVSKPNHSIDNCGPVKFPEKNFILDPYVLGVWLGDGSSKNSIITQHVNEHEELLENFKLAGFNLTKLEDNRNQHFKCPELLPLLKQLNVFDNKHIPESYLYGSVEQRLALLQGLMDTDGTIDKKGHCTFDNTNKNLVDGVAFLAASLGIKCNKAERVGRLYDVDKKICYRVWFTTDLPVFRLKRKLDRLRPVSQKAKQRMIVSIEPTIPVPMRCVRVSDHRHLFLITESFIPTHNTYGCVCAITKNAWTKDGSLNWWVAPTYSQSEMAFQKTLEFLPEGFYKAYKGDLKIEILDPNNKVRSLLEYKSADKEGSLRGFGVHFFILDEAARTSYDAYVSVITTTTQVGGRGIIISTPMGRNWFYDEYQKGEKFNEDGSPRFSIENPDPFPEYFSMRLATRFNPTVDPSQLEFLKKTLPLENFEQEYEAKFLKESAGVFKNISGCTAGDFQPPLIGRKYQMGVDLARKKDFTVITVVDKLTKHVVFFDRFNQISWPIQYKKIKEIHDFYNKATVVLDSTGLGDPVAAALEDMGMEINSYNISSATLKKNLIDSLRIKLEQSQITFPNIPVLIDELKAYEYTTTNSSTLKFSAPSGKHDDCVISLALATYEIDSKPSVYKLQSTRGI